MHKLKHWQEEWLCSGGWITQIKTGRVRKMDLGGQPNMYVSDNLMKKWNRELKKSRHQVCPFLISTAWFFSVHLYRAFFHPLASLGNLAFLAPHGPWPRQGSFGPNLISARNSSTRLSSEYIRQDRLMAATKKSKISVTSDNKVLFLVDIAV